MPSHPLWVKFIASKLCQQPIVTDLRLLHTRIKVRYKTGVTDTYYFNKAAFKKHGKNPHFAFLLDEECARFGRQVEIYNSYPVGPLDDCHDIKYHFTMDRGEFVTASFLDRRIAMHRFIHSMLDSMKDQSYPLNVLERDLEALKDIKLGKFIVGDSFKMFPRIRRDAPWTRLLDHFFGVSDISTKTYFFAIRDIVESTQSVKINTFEIIRRSRWKKKWRRYNPVAYASFLKRFNVTSVIDMHPDRGHKALAAALLGIKYIAPPNARLDNALTKNICGITGLDYEPLGNQKVSHIISDHNFTQFGIEGIKPIMSQAGGLIAFVPRDERASINEKYRPNKLVQIFTTPVDSESMRPDYLAMW